MMRKDEKRLLGAEAGAPSPGGMGISINRTGGAVSIRLQCGSDYQAIELYERLVEAAQKGVVTIEMLKR